jgi:hypothetical protein
MDDIEAQPAVGIGSLFKAFVGGVGVAGVGFSVFGFVASMLMFHGDNTIPLLWALFAGIISAGGAACGIRLIFKRRIL